MTKRDAAPPSAAFHLGILVGLAPIQYIGAFVVFYYGTLDISDGRWVKLIVDYLGTINPDLLSLLGVRSRLVWSALAVLYALIMASAGAYSLVVLARRAGPFRAPVVGAFALVSIAVGVATWVLGPSQFSACAGDPCGAGCATKSTGIPFSIIPYMGAVFCRIYEPSFVSFFWSFYTVALPVQVPVYILTFAAGISLIIGPRSMGRWTTADLRQRIADFRVLFILYSAIVTLFGLSELTMWGWLADIAAGSKHAEYFRNLQIGSALFWGMCNSALLLLFFAPLGSLLARLARALADLHCEGASIPALEEWEREQGVSLLGRAAWPQIAGILAPLLTAALAFLFQSAVGG